MKYIKFIGDFKILIPMGFKFGKYYARNYKAYSKMHSEWHHDMIIWVKGRDVQLEGLNDIQSYYTSKYIKDNKYPIYEEDYESVLFKHEKGDPMHCKLNDYTGQILSDKDFMNLYDFKKAFKEHKFIDYYKDGWHDLYIPRRTLELVKHFFNHNLLKLVEE